MSRPFSPKNKEKYLTLFLHQKGLELGLEEDHQTQQKGHEKKQNTYCIGWVRRSRGASMSN